MADPLTKAQFIARSDTYCRKTWGRMLRRFAIYKRAPKNAGDSAGRVFAHATGDIFLPIILFWYDQINSLSRPPGDSAQIERFLTTGLQRAVETALDRPYSFESPAELAAHYRRSNRLVRGYGIRDCVVTTASFADRAG